nr:hypothetical protein [Clostridia bacterium]
MIEDRENFSAENNRRRTNRNAIISVLVAVAILITFFLGYFVRGYNEPAYSRKISEIIKLRNGMSVYLSDIDDDDLAKYLVAYLLKDDEYAYYYTPEEYERLLQEDSGNYSGLGVGFFADGTVAKVYLNSPAYNNGQGLKEGDEFYSGIYKGDSNYTVFADKLTEEKSELEVYAEFISEFDMGEDINLKVKRGDEILPFTLTKAEYTVSYVEYKDTDGHLYFFSDGDEIDSKTPLDASGVAGLSADTGYIKLHAFSGDAAEQFAAALTEMRARGRTKLILDLRDNGGGQIDILLDIASYLINDEESSDSIRVLKVQERDAKISYYTPSNNFTGDITDISVIADTNTASASECLIGALNDYGETGAAFSLDRLVLTGQDKQGVYRTFGKGIMQTTIKLKSGGALKLTTAYIYWPISVDEDENPICIQGKGIRTEVAENQVSDADAIARADAVLH